ncbi:hypothetical protein TcasGA2_TC002708 [Tribolium castaneum]|uniref:Uncharacterized protein n=1 Tax=Tribolium castaneum TaxID=7070 RepID=D6WDU8_TRICA|nr:hypothetical protein TcasGA2_TC002708 [Tribolium castaneum]
MCEFLNKTFSFGLEKREKQQCMCRGWMWRVSASVAAHLRLGEVDETALLLGEVLRGPLLVLPVALVLKHLNLIGAAEIIAATGRDVWHGSLAATAQRHHTALAHYMAPLSAAHVVTRSTLAARHCVHVHVVVLLLAGVLDVADSNLDFGWAPTDSPLGQAPALDRVRQSEPLGRRRAIMAAARLRTSRADRSRSHSRAFTYHYIRD